MFNLKRRSSHGFSLVELLLVLAIIGIISGIAIPTFMGQRKRARIIGDAKSNAAALAMQMEARKAEAGVYGTAGTTVTWTQTASGGMTVSSATFLPNFSLSHGTQMNYTLTVNNSGVGYALTVKDPKRNGTPTVLTMDQSGAVVLSSTY